MGLLLAGNFTMAGAAITGLETAAIAFAVLMILRRFSVNPALLILAAAIVGVNSFGPQYPGQAQTRKSRKPPLAKPNEKRQALHCLFTF